MNKKIDLSKIGLERFTHPDKFGEWLGYEIVELDRKNHKSTNTLQMREDHLSMAGRVHGGVLAAFLDFSMGTAVFSTMNPRELTSTVELKINYLKPVENGDLLRAESEVVFIGKRLRTVRSTLFKNKEKEPVAIASGTFYIIGEKIKKVK